MAITVKLNRVNGDYGFDSINENGNNRKMDTNPKWAGRIRRQASHLLLNASFRCSSIDVISILKTETGNNRL